MRCHRSRTGSRNCQQSVARNHRHLIRLVRLTGSRSSFSDNGSAVLFSWLQLGCGRVEAALGACSSSRSTRTCPPASVRRCWIRSARSAACFSLQLAELVNLRKPSEIQNNNTVLGNSLSAFIAFNLPRPPFLILFVRL